MKRQTPWPAILVVGLGLMMAGCQAQPRQIASATETGVAPMQKQASPDSGGWRALLVAGETNSYVFNNAVTRMNERLVSAGLPASSIRVVRSGPSLGAAQLEQSMLEDGFRFLSSPSSDGCLVFMTSHGLAQGLIIHTAERRTILSPEDLQGALTAACGQKPTVVITSGCYSGVYANRLTPAPNRVILTAARSDRTSFGCDARGTLNVFDRCLLRAMNGDPTWSEIAEATARCVTAEEGRLGATPPSLPQTRVGANLADTPLSVIH